MGFVTYSKLALMLLLMPAAFAQSTVILTVAPPQKLAAKRNADATAKIAVSIAAGYHINSNAPHEAYLIPLRLTWTPAPLTPPCRLALMPTAIGRFARRSCARSPSCATIRAASSGTSSM
jgi:hypothetical protein